MKRISIVFLIIALFTSCSFKNEAERRLPKYMKSIVADPEQTVEDKTIVWSDDSLCVIDATIRARNESGGYEFSKYEYFLIKTNGELYEGSLCLQRGNNKPNCSLLESIEAHYRLEDFYKENGWKYERGTLQENYHRQAIESIDLYGRKVED